MHMKNSQTNAFSKCVSQRQRGCKNDANHIYRLQENLKIETHTDVSQTVEKHLSICLLKEGKI